MLECRLFTANAMKSPLVSGFCFAEPAVPDGPTLGLGCGTPVALASLEPGQTVLDLSTGAGEGQREPPLCPIR